MERIASGRPEIGTVLNLSGIGCCRVESNTDPSLVALTTPNGGTLRVGERALARMLLESASEDDTRK